MDYICKKSCTCEIRIPALGESATTLTFNKGEVYDLDNQFFGLNASDLIEVNGFDKFFEQLRDYNIKNILDE